jgi:hypothetical protein
VADLLGAVHALLRKAGGQVLRCALPPLPPARPEEAAQEASDDCSLVRGGGVSARTRAAFISAAGGGSGGAGSTGSMSAGAARFAAGAGAGPAAPPAEGAPMASAPDATAAASPLLLLEQLLPFLDWDLKAHNWTHRPFIRCALGQRPWTVT